MVCLFSLRAFHFGVTVKFSSLINDMFMGVCVLVGQGTGQCVFCLQFSDTFLFSWVYELEWHDYFSLFTSKPPLFPPGSLDVFPYTAFSGVVHFLYPFFLRHQI